MSQPEPPDAFETRLSRLRAWLVLLARLHLDLCARDQEASDVVQNALVDAVKYRDKLAGLGDEDLRRWLRRVLRNKVIDFYRRRQPQLLEADLYRIEADICDSFWRLDALAVDSESSPSQRMERQEQFERLARGLEQLDDGQREILVLRDLSAWPLKKIAAHYGCTLGVVAGRLRRAREALYALLEVHGEESGNRHR